MMKIFMKNGSYKSIVVTSEDTFVIVYFYFILFFHLISHPPSSAKTLADSVADKLNMAKYATYFDVIEVVRGQGSSSSCSSSFIIHASSIEKRLDPNQNIVSCKKKWPTIIGSSGANETETQVRIVCLLLFFFYFVCF